MGGADETEDEVAVLCSFIIFHCQEIKKGATMFYGYKKKSRCE